MTIHLLCDRCRAEGVTGDDPFADYADLLDFDPVPRKRRADGWDEECQRAFIAALAATGSARQAAAAVGKAQFGVENLKKAKGNESFMAAFERALDFHAENRSLRLADGVRHASALTAHRHANAPRPAWSHAATRQGPSHPGRKLTGRRPDPGPQDDETRDRLFVETILHKYLLKLESERRARTDGRIAEADFYVRQLTYIEVALDAATHDAFDLLRELRIGGCLTTNVAQTPMSALLDEARRAHWERCGDPPRPGPPAIDLLRPQRDGVVTEPTLVMHGDLPESMEEQRRKFESTYAREAEAHVRWEAEARADYAERKAREAELRSDLREKPEEAGQPAPEATGLTSRDSLA